MKDETKGQMYFRSFIKNSLTDLRNNQMCYAYNKEQLEEIKKRVKEDITIKEVEFGISKAYIIRLKK